MNGCNSGIKNCQIRNLKAKITGPCGRFFLLPLYPFMSQFAEAPEITSGVRNPSALANPIVSR